jgi:glycosyltransferase involved in cell wall biosynthesis
MGKMKSHKPVLKKKFYPFVSICTPTFNRRPFIPMMLECFRNQTYPKDRMEWIIVDDGTDKVRDLIESSGIKQIRYYNVDTKMTLGKKRNYMHSFVKGTIIVYMDDDDYYPPERVSHAVEKLTENRNAMCAGSSELYIYFKHINQMYQCGPYGPNHATAGTFAFRTELLKDSRYDDGAALAEEKQFLKNYTVPFVQLDPMKSILVFSHNHNTFDKKKLLDNAHPDYFKPCTKTIDMFIQEEKEVWIKDFFMNKIDDLLANYEPGEPKMKPDVLKQTKEIEEERAKMMQQQQSNSPIMMSKDGQEPKALSSQEIITIINSQKTDIQNLLQQNKELQNIVVQLQQQLLQVSNQPRDQVDSNNVDTEKLILRIKELEDINSGLEKKLSSKVKVKSSDKEISAKKMIDISDEIIILRCKSDPEVIL